MNHSGPSAEGVLTEKMQAAGPERLTTLGSSRRSEKTSWILQGGRLGLVEVYYVSASPNPSL